MLIQVDVVERLKNFSKCKKKIVHLLLSNSPSYHPLSPGSAEGGKTS